MKIAIDGPAGAGKSTVAKLISEKLGINYLDTGAMYRSIAYALINKGIDPEDADAVKDHLDEVDIEVKYIKRVQHMYLDGKDISKLIRTNDISMGASNVSKIPDVRLKLIEMQQEIARNFDIVMDGRDICTYVLPDADHKFFITASVDERARRRFKELPEGSNLTFEDIREDIIKRDKNDSEREFMPLKQAEDAVLVDTTDMNIDEVIDFVLKEIAKG